MAANTQTPGEQLSEFISDIVRTENPEKGFLKSIDGLLSADGEFLGLFKKSIIFYTVRRLIHGASFALEKAMVHYADSQNAIPVIKEYINSNYSFDLDVESMSRLHAIVYSCVDASKKNLTRAQRAKALQSFKEKGTTTCYMCGTDIDFQTVDNENSASVEHIFPSEYGGNSQIENLALSCKDCNKQKDDHMHPSDFHFEKISTKHHDDHAKFSNQLLPGKNAVAIWLKEHCECTICGESASDVGMLSVFQKEPSDSWHFLNIGVKCSSHEQG